MQIIPALDLLGEDAVRLEQGDYERVLFREPLEAFMARLVATRPALIHVVDLEGARDGALRPALIERCRRRRAGYSPSGLGRDSVRRGGSRRPERRRGPRHRRYGALGAGRSSEHVCGGAR